MSSFSNDYLPFATGASPTVITQSVYSALTARSTGFQAGVADEYQVNKVWRQASVNAAMIGQFTADYGPGNVVDDGNISAYEAQFEAALKSYLVSTPAAIPGFSSNNLVAQSMGNNVVAQYPIAAGSSTFGTVSSGTFVFSRAGIYWIGALLSQSFVYSGSPGNFGGNAFIYHNSSQIVGSGQFAGSWGTSSTWSINCGAVVNVAVNDTVSVECSVFATFFTSATTNTASVTIIPLL